MVAMVFFCSNDVFALRPQDEGRKDEAVKGTFSGFGSDGVLDAAVWTPERLKKFADNFENEESQEWRKFEKERGLSQEVLRNVTLGLASPDVETREAAIRVVHIIIDLAIEDEYGLSSADLEYAVPAREQLIAFIIGFEDSDIAHRAGATLNGVIAVCETTNELHTKDSRVQIRAAEALGSIYGTVDPFLQKDIREALIAALDPAFKDQIKGAERAILQAAGKAQCLGAVEFELGDPRLAPLAVRVLSEMDTDQGDLVYRIYEPLLERSNNWRVRLEAARALEKRCDKGNIRAVSILVRAVREDASKSVRRASAIALGNIGTVGNEHFDVVANLQPALNNEEDDATRAAIATALAKIEVGEDLKNATRIEPSRPKTIILVTKDAAEMDPLAGALTARRTCVVMDLKKSDTQVEIARKVKAAIIEAGLRPTFDRINFYCSDYDPSIPDKEVKIKTALLHFDFYAKGVGRATQSIQLNPVSFSIRKILERTKDETEDMANEVIAEAIHSTLGDLSLWGRTTEKGFLYPSYNPILKELADLVRRGA